MRFASLTRPEIEIIARDVDARSEVNWKLSAAFTAFFTSLVELVVNDFSALTPYGKAFLTLLLAGSFVATVFYGWQWLCDRKRIEEIISERIREFQGSDHAQDT